MKIKTIKDIKKYVNKKNKSFLKKISAEEALDMIDDLIEKKIRELGKDKLRYEEIKVKVNKDHARIPVLSNGYKIAILRKLRGY